MANWTVIAPYSENDAAWLRKEGFPAPHVRDGNEMPSTADLKWALEAAEGLEFEYPSGEDEFHAESEAGGLEISGFDWDDDPSTAGDHFMARGGDDLLALLVRLCERCGQLYYCPDTGDPAIVLTATLDPQAVAELHAEACEQEDPWAYFFEQMYGPGGLAAEG